MQKNIISIFTRLQKLKSRVLAFLKFSWKKIFFLRCNFFFQPELFFHRCQKTHLEAPSSYLQEVMEGLRKNIFLEMKKIFFWDEFFFCNRNFFFHRFQKTHLKAPSSYLQEVKEVLRKNIFLGWKKIFFWVEFFFCKRIFFPSVSKNHSECL